MLEKTKVYMSFFPDIVNKEELAAQMAEKFGDDPTKILKESIFGGGQPEQGLMDAQKESPMSMNPQGNVANNIARGLRSGEQG